MQAFSRKKFTQIEKAATIALVALRSGSSRFFHEIETES